MTPTPPVITRVGMPSVWESTAWKTRDVRIVVSRPAASGDAGGSALGRETRADRRLGRGANDGLLLGREREPGLPARAAVPPDEVHRQLDGLDELGPRVPAEQRMEPAVQRQRHREILRHRGVPEV